MSSGTNGELGFRLRNVEVEVGPQVPEQVSRLRLIQFGELVASATARDSGMQSDEILQARRILDRYEPVSSVRFQYNPHVGFYAQVSGSDTDPNIGGAGVTRKNLLQHDIAMPGLGARIEREQDKIVILGNGFSDLAIELAESYIAGAIHDAPVVVDMIDYNLVYEDLRVLFERSKAGGVPFPFINDLRTVEKIVQLTSQGSLKTVQHYFGGGESLGSDAHGANLSINLFGPPFCTLGEQLRILRPGGELWLATFVPQDLGNGFHIRPFPLPQLDGMLPLEHPARLLWGCIIQKNSGAGG